VPLQWQEKDCLPWAKQRLGELFQQLPLGDGVTTQLKSVEGDCVLNVRCGASA
jgi:activator of HSP90 ATPase